MCVHVCLQTIYLILKVTHIHRYAHACDYVVSVKMAGGKPLYREARSKLVQAILDGREEGRGMRG